MNQPQSVFFSLRVLKFITILKTRLCSKKNYSRQPSVLKLWNPRCDVQGKTGLSLLLGDRRFIEEKTYWMHKQNDEFMQQRDKCIPQISVECRTRKKKLIFFTYFLYIILAWIALYTVLHTGWVTTVGWVWLQRWIVPYMYIVFLTRMYLTSHYKLSMYIISVV